MNVPKLLCILRCPSFLLTTPLLRRYLLPHHHHIFVIPPLPLRLQLSHPFHLPTGILSEVEADLVPPPLGHLNYRPSICRQIYLQYQTSCNILCYSILATGDVCLRLLKTHCRHFRVQRWVNPTACRVPTLLYSHHTLGNPGVEHSKGISNPRGNDPGLKVE